MKLTREDIKQFATEDEKKKLTERRVEVKKRKLDRRTNISKFEEYKEYLRVNLSDIDIHFQWEAWDDLEMSLECAMADVRRVKQYASEGE